MKTSREHQAFEWQVGVCDQMSDQYIQEVDQRFLPIVEGVITRAALRPGERILDLGTGTGSVALHAAEIVGHDGIVVGNDISPDMLSIARRRATDQGLTNIIFREGRAEATNASDSEFDVVLASLSMMYVIDRAAAAREIARVLRPGGRFVATVWAAPDVCDIVMFQQTAGSFAPPPPVTDVGPGALADATIFLQQLSDVGIEASVEHKQYEFEFDDFESAWNVLAGVTTGQLAPEIQENAKQAVRSVMWTEADQPRRFCNTTQFIVGNA